MSRGSKPPASNRGKRRCVTRDPQSGTPLLQRCWPVPQKVDPEPTRRRCCPKSPMQQHCS